MGRVLSILQDPTLSSPAPLPVCGSERYYGEERVEVVEVGKGQWEGEGHKRSAKSK